MSEGFEKTVISMLQEQNQKLSEIMLILHEHDKKLDLHTKLLEEHDKKLDLHTKLLEEHDKKLDLHTKLLEEHDKKLDLHEQKLEKHDEKLDLHEQRLEKIMQILMHIEEQVTTKIPALFDSHLANLDKHKQFEEEISSLDSTVENHSVRISVLETITSKTSEQLKNISKN